MNDLYTIIKRLCDEKGIRPSKLCADTGISRGLITDLKMGRKQGVSAVTAQKIASYFGVSVGYLLGEDAEKMPTPVSESGQPVNIVKIVGRDGSYVEKRLTDDQVKALRAIVDQFLDASDDL